MSVRAKFHVAGNVGTPENGHQITMTAVYDADPNSENGQFFRWTPSGTITMGVVNEEAAKQFVVGEFMYVDFSSAKAVEPC